MQRLRFEFSADWAPQKQRIADLEIRRLLSTLRGAQDFAGITVVNAEKPKERPLLKLVCANEPGHPEQRACGMQWEAAVFSNCPKCNKRNTVRKQEEVEVWDRQAKESPQAGAA